MFDFSETARYAEDKKATSNIKIAYSGHDIQISVRFLDVYTFPRRNTSKKASSHLADGRKNPRLEKVCLLFWRWPGRRG